MSALLTHPIRFHGERGRWMVPSTSQPQVPNFVDMDEYEGNGWCSCDDFKFRKMPHLDRGATPADAHRCKHILAVIEEMKMLKEWKIE